MWFTTLAVYCAMLLNTGISAEVCRSKACVSLANTIRRTMDPKLNPCDDFYYYTCAKYIKENDVPEGKTEVSIQAEISENISRLLLRDLENKKLNGQLNVFQIAKDFFASCVNTGAVEKIGLEYIKQKLIEYGGFPLLDNNWNPSDFYWVDLIQKIAEDGMPYEMIISVKPGFNNRNISQSLLEVGPPVLQIDSSYLLNGMDDPVVKVYYQVLVDVAVEFGADKKSAEDAMLKFIEFERELAEISITKETDFFAMLKLKKISQLQKEVPSLDWLYLFNSIVGEYVKLKEDDFIQLYIPEFVQKLGPLIQRQCKRDLANYILMKVIINQIPYLPQRIQAIYKPLLEAVNGKFKTKPQRKICIDNIQYAYPLELTVIMAAGYIHKYVDPKLKESATIVAEAYRKQLIKLLSKADDWFDSKRRARAIRQVQNTKIVAAYPKELGDEKFLDQYFEKLIFSPKEYFKNSMELRKFRRYIQINRLKEANDVTYFADQELGSSMFQNTYINNVANLIGIYTGSLTGILFDVKRPSYLNTATLGLYGGFSLTQIPSATSELDENGNIGGWWDDKTTEAFERKRQAVVDTYSTYVIRDLNETLIAANKVDVIVASQGAFKMGYMALEEALANLPEDPRLIGFEKFSSRQLYFIVNAVSFCANVKISALKNIQSAFFPPNEVRINGVYRNSPDFAQAFGCHMGSNMNPKTKVNFW